MRFIYICLLSVKRRQFVTFLGSFFLVQLQTSSSTVIPLFHRRRRRKCPGLQSEEEVRRLSTDRNTSAITSQQILFGFIDDSCNLLVSYSFTRFDWFSNKYKGNIYFDNIFLVLCRIGAKVEAGAGQVCWVVWGGRTQRRKFRFLERGYHLA
jgi:hypothetical protein